MLKMNPKDDVLALPMHLRNAIRIPFLRGATESRSVIVRSFFPSSVPFIFNHLMVQATSFSHLELLLQNHRLGYRDSNTLRTKLRKCITVVQHEEIYQPCVRPGPNSTASCKHIINQPRRVHRYHPFIFK